MSLVQTKLVTIICEAQLEHDLLQDFDNMAVKGYTISEARGKGHRGLRAADWEQNRNIRIDIVCSAQDGEKIMLHLRDNYYEDFAMISYMTEVDVMRDNKFV